MPSYPFPTTIPLNDKFWCVRSVIQIQFSYVSSVRDKLLDVLRCGSFKPMFSDDNITECDDAGGYDALLTLSRDAGGLLRHTGTCCVRSVADVLDVQPDRLLVMVSTGRSPTDSETLA